MYPLSSGWIINAYACVFLGTDVTLCYITRNCTSHTSRLPRTCVVRWLGEKKGLLCSLVGRGDVRSVGGVGKEDGDVCGGGGDTCS